MKQRLISYISRVTGRQDNRDAVARNSLPRPPSDTFSLRTKETNSHYPEDGGDVFLRNVGDMFRQNVCS
jgi:hypothetical protein